MTLPGCVIAAPPCGEVMAYLRLRFVKGKTHVALARPVKRLLR
jgi:hypothetical protein